MGWKVYLFAACFLFFCCCLAIRLSSFVFCFFPFVFSIFVCLLHRLPSIFRCSLSLLPPASPVLLLLFVVVSSRLSAPAHLSHRSCVVCRCLTFYCCFLHCRFHALVLCCIRPLRVCSSSYILFFASTAAVPRKLLSASVQAAAASLAAYWKQA